MKKDDVNTRYDDKKVVKVGTAFEKRFKNSANPKYDIILNSNKVPEPQNDRIEIVLVKKKDNNQGSHDVVLNYPGRVRGENDIYISLEKKKYEQLLKNEDDTIYLEAWHKNAIQDDKADIIVSQLNENGEKTIVGKGWTSAQSIKIDPLGIAWRNKSFTGNIFTGENSEKVYNIAILKGKLERLSENRYGNVNISFAPKRNNEKELVAYKSLGKDSYSEFTVSINKKDTLKIDADDRGFIQLKSFDKKEITKDLADLLVSENAFKKEKEKADMLGIDIKEVSGSLNIVGKGYTHNPRIIRLFQHDQKVDGLSKAIALNHTVKTMAILNKFPQLANHTHLQLMKEMKNNGEKVDGSLEKMVVEHIQKNSHDKGIRL